MRHGILLLMLALPVPIRADTIVVHPDGAGDYPTIQAAIDAASDGDEIVLGDGVFTGSGNYDIRYDGKEIVVRSLSGVASSCVIDCENIRERAFHFQAADGPLAVLADVTITGTTYFLPAIHLEGASPTIRGVVLRDFLGQGVQSALGSPLFEDLTVRGGGTYALSCVGGAPVIRGSLIEANSIGGSGGAVTLSLTDATIEDTVIRDNLATDNTVTIALAIGPGTTIVRGCEIRGNLLSNPASLAAVAGGSSQTATIVFEDCTIENNGGGVELNSSPWGPVNSFTLRDCTIRGYGVRARGRSNVAMEGCLVEGTRVGVWVLVPTTVPLTCEVTDCIIRDNVWSGVHVSSSDVTIERCEIRGNGVSGVYSAHADNLAIRDCVVTGNGSNGIQLYKCASGTIDGSTIASNGTTGVLIGESAAEIRETIVWGNCVEQGSEIFVDAVSSVTLDCVVVDTNAIDGDGTVVLSGPVFETDPLFCAAVECNWVPSSAGLYTLDPSSPALEQTCGRIGARGSGCVNPTRVQRSIEVLSWGQIKSRYR